MQVNLPQCCSTGTHSEGLSYLSCLSSLRPHVLVGKNNKVQAPLLRILTGKMSQKRLGRP